MADEQGYTHESGGQYQEDDKAPPEQQHAAAILAEAKDNYTFTKSYEDLQRKAEEEELEFEGLDMWGDARDARGEQEDPVTGAKIPSKPTVSVNLLAQNIQQTVAEARQARLAVTVKPKAGISNTKISGYLKGLLRSVQVESGALENRLWAPERAAKVGRGGYRITADFANDGDFDLDLIEERILDYSTVYWDPYGVKASREDCDWALETDWISERERKRRWKDKPIIAPANAFTDEKDDWFAADGAEKQNRRVRIITYYRKEYATYTLGYHPQSGQAWIGQVPPHRKDDPVMNPDLAEACAQKAPGTRLREVPVATVMIYILDGTQILEQRPWHGRYIPIVEVIGKEYFVKGKRRWKGIIADGADLLRAINVLISASLEVAGSMPRTPYMMAEGQDEGFEEMWDDAGVKNYTRLYYRPVDVEGKLAPPPQRQQTEPEIQGLMLLIRMMHEMYHAVTGSVAPQMRAVNPYDRSGKAIEALQRQGAAGTSNYLDNMATISMLYEGKVLIDAAPHYYDRPGRVLRVMGEENDDETAIMLKKPFIRNKDGEPVKVPCPACGGSGQERPEGLVGSVTAYFSAPKTCRVCEGSKDATRETMPPEFQGKPVEYVDFADGEFKVQAAIDRNFQTKQDEALAGMQALAGAAPGMVPLYADLWVRAMGFSGANEIADRIKAQNPSLQTPEDMDGVPPAVVAKFQALAAKHQQAMDGLQQAQRLLETDTVKQAGQKEIAMIKLGLQEKLEALKVQSKMLQVKEEGAMDARLEQLRGRLESMRQEAEHRHEILLELLKEKKEKEIERHSVELHDAAAAKAAERADLSASVSASTEEERQMRADARADTRSVGAETRQEGREVRAADREAQRERDAAERARQTETDKS